LEDAPLAAMRLVPWAHISALLAEEKKQAHRSTKIKEKVLFERSGFGEEGGEGDAY
jgi:U6 snRNA-associated Sm-like protein LSm1